MANFGRLKPQSVEGWLAWVIVLMLALFSLLSREFLSIQNVLDLAESYAVTGILPSACLWCWSPGGLISPLQPWPPWCNTWSPPCCLMM